MRDNADEQAVGDINVEWTNVGDHFATADLDTMWVLALRLMAADHSILGGAVGRPPEGEELPSRSLVR